MNESRSAAAPLAGSVLGTHLGRSHSFSKQSCDAITLLAGLGVEGDAHCGALVRHRHLVKKDPTKPNRTQVHLLESERLDELRARGFQITPGEMGENLTTAGIDLRRLPLGTRLRLGATAEVELTGLRTPCFQMNKFRKGLMAACLERDAGGTSICNAGVMSIVAAGGIVRAGDAIAVTLPSGKLIPLEPI